MTTHTSQRFQYFEFLRSPSTRAILPLAVKKHSSYRQTKIVELSKVSGDEVLTPPRSINRLPAKLPE